MKRPLTHEEILTLIGPANEVVPQGLDIQADPDDLEPPDFSGWSRERQVEYWNALHDRYQGYQKAPRWERIVIGRIFMRNLPPILARHRAPV
jgi:hypothetical protein